MQVSLILTTIQRAIMGIKKKEVSGAQIYSSVAGSNFSVYCYPFSIKLRPLKRPFSFTIVG